MFEFAVTRGFELSIKFAMLLCFARLLSSSCIDVTLLSIFLTVAVAAIPRGGFCFPIGRSCVSLCGTASVDNWLAMRVIAVFILADALAASSTDGAPVNLVQE